MAALTNRLALGEHGAESSVRSRPRCHGGGPSVHFKVTMPISFRLSRCNSCPNGLPPPHSKYLVPIVLTAALLAACGGGAEPTIEIAAEAAAEGRQYALAAMPAAAAALAFGGGPSGATSDPVRDTRTGPRGINPPLVFNASSSARAGETVSLQGENFGTAPVVTLDGVTTTPLDIVNRVGTGWLAVQIPASARGALLLRVRNATGTSAQVRLNAARPLHLDTLQLEPGGAFKVFGRNLLLPGSVPRITVDGLAAAVDVARSNEHMLMAVAPLALRPNAAAVLRVDNGNRSGATALDRRIEAVATGSGDPFALGVGWGAGFAPFAGRTVDAASDTRLAQKMVCDGRRDDSPALQAAIELAAASGGGVVRLPAGRCRMLGGMELRSRVVVQGAGKDSTELLYESNYPLFGQGLDLAGVRDLSLTNAAGAGEGPLLKDSRRVFLQNLRVKLGTSRQMYLTGNRNFVVSGCDFEQTGSISNQGPYTLENTAGLVFTGNSTAWVDGSPTFGRVHDSLIQGNRFTRDGRPQAGGGAVHSMTLDFAHRVAVVGNIFEVAHGPITNTLRNDGEALLTEGGGARRTENIGSVASATERTLSDPNNTLAVDPFGGGSVPENYGIAIVAGRGAGQTRRVTAYSRPMLTIEPAWDVVPDATSRYATFVWGLEAALIKDNVFSHNPRGIWIYHTAVRDVDVIGNTFSEGGGIYLRSFQNLATRSFMPIYNVLIARNQVSNSTGRWMSYINSVFVNADARSFGIATLGIEMRANHITANRPNVSSAVEEYANTEGYMNMMRVENYSGYESSVVPRMLGSIIENNSCTRCDVGVRIGTGAGGTTLLQTRLIDSGEAFSDSASTVGTERSTDTVSR